MSEELLPPAEPWKFPPLLLLQESLLRVGRQWRVLLRWSVVPLVVMPLLALLENLPGGTEKQATSLVPPVWSYAAPLLGFFVSLAQFWMIAPLEIRIYRQLLLDEQPSSSYGRELFASRTWWYLSRGLLANVQWWLVSSSLLVVGLLLLVLGSFRFASLGLAHGYPAPEFFFFFGSYLLVVLALTYCFFAPRLALVYPDAATDGATSLAGLAELGRDARWRILLVVGLIWLIPFLIGWGWWLPFLIGKPGTLKTLASPLTYCVQAVLGSVLLLPFRWVMCTAKARIYRRLVTERLAAREPSVN